MVNSSSNKKLFNFNKELPQCSPELPDDAVSDTTKNDSSKSDRYTISQRYSQRMIKTNTRYL
jgi:hypothetical protein